MEKCTFFSIFSDKSVNIKAFVSTNACCCSRKRLVTINAPFDEQEWEQSETREIDREALVTGTFRHNFRRASIFMQIGSKHLVRPADWYSWRHAAPHSPPRFIVQNSARIFILIISHGFARGGETRGMQNEWMQSRQWCHTDYDSVLLNVSRWKRFYYSFDTLSYLLSQLVSALTWMVFD